MSCYRRPRHSPGRAPVRAWRASLSKILGRFFAEDDRRSGASVIAPKELEPYVIAAGNRLSALLLDMSKDKSAAARITATIGRTQRKIDHDTRVDGSVFVINLFRVPAALVGAPVAYREALIIFIIARIYVEKSETVDPAGKSLPPASLLTEKALSLPDTVVAATCRRLWN